MRAWMPRSAKYGAKDYIRTRETYMTQVYNYFAYPPTLTHFCDAALVMSRECGDQGGRLARFFQAQLCQFFARL
jgi:hypothetical protein